MVNPFDRTFFKFLLGFTLMLTLSFAVFFYIGKNSVDPKTLSAKTEKADKIDAASCKDSKPGHVC